ALPLSHRHTHTHTHTQHSKETKKSFREKYYRSDNYITKNTHLANHKRKAGRHAAQKHHTLSLAPHVLTTPPPHTHTHTHSLTVFCVNTHTFIRGLFLLWFHLTCDIRAGREKGKSLGDLR